MNLDRFNPAGWTAQFTLDLVKHQKEAERFFKEGEVLYAKLKKERSALGSLEDAKIADELSAKKLQEAAEVLWQAEQAAAKKIEDADSAARSRENALDEREGALKTLEKEIEEGRRQLNRDFASFQQAQQQWDKRAEREAAAFQKQKEDIERRVNKCRRVLKLAAEISKIKI